MILPLNLGYAHEKNVSLYALLRELLYDGKAGLVNDAEPLTPEIIVEELTNRTGKEFHLDKTKWVVGLSTIATKVEKGSLAMTYKIIKAEEKFDARRK